MPRQVASQIQVQVPLERVRAFVLCCVCWLICKGSSSIGSGLGQCIVALWPHLPPPVFQIEGYKLNKGEAEVSADINRRLVAAMTERLRPGGDSASLVYCAQNLVESRFKTMKIESVQAATRLFEDVVMEMLQELKSTGQPL